MADQTKTPDLPAVYTKPEPDDKATEDKAIPVNMDELELPMPCFYVAGKEWKQGTIVHFTTGGHGMQAVVKPADSDSFVVAGLEHHVKHGHKKPQYVPK